MTRRALLVVAAAAVVAVAVAATLGLGAMQPSEEDSDTMRAVVVARMTLVDSVDASGEVGFGAVTTLRYTPPPEDEGGGASVWSPGCRRSVPLWSVAVLFRVDDQPRAAAFPTEALA